MQRNTFVRVVLSRDGLKRYFHVVFLCIRFLVKNIEENQMKRILILSLSAVFVLGIAGCQANQEATVTTQAADIQIATESQTDASSETTKDDSKTDTSVKTAETSFKGTAETTVNTATVTVEGTWQSASMVEKEENKSEPEFYVRFTRNEIQYGHMSAEGEFVNDRSDKITRLDVTIEGKFLIQAESQKAGKYTFKTSEKDLGIMEYYTTWDEAAFADNYVGGSSISKCK